MLGLLGGLLCAAPAAAQAPDAAPAAGRADFQAVLGWQNLRVDRDGDPFDRPDHNWAHAILFGGAGVGYYWTEHLKTQIDAGAGTPTRHYQYRARSVNGLQASEISRVRLTRPSIAVSQQYQFFRNEWFHPHLTAGLDIARQTRTEHFEPIFGWDPVLRITRELAPGRTVGPDRRWSLRPFAGVGFKAYMTRRTFFTSDMRLMVRGGIDQVLFRTGFGVDF